MEDVHCAVRWLRAHAEQYGIDPDRIGVIGYSAGAHLACRLGTSGEPELEKTVWIKRSSSKVQAVVSCSGILDLAGPNEEINRGELVNFASSP